MSGTTGSPVLLTAMLAHPSWRGVVALTLQGGGEQVLGGAVLARDVHAQPADLDGRLLVVLVSSDRADWRLDALLHRAQAAGAGAVLLDGVQPLHLATRALAERLALPVLGSDDPVGAYVALTLVAAEPQILKAKVVLRAVAAVQRASEDVDSVLRELAGALGRPVTLLGPAAVPVAGPALLSGDELPAAAEDLTTAAARVAAPLRIDLPSGAVLVAHPVAGGAASWLAVRLPAPLLAEVEAAGAAAAVGSAAVQQRLALRRLTLERDARARTSLLGELLGGPADLAAARRRALDMGWRLDGWHTGIRLGAAADTDVAALRADVVASMEAEGLDAVVVEQGDGWSAWLTAEQEPPAEKVERDAAAVRGAQRRLAGSVPTYVGVGRVHPGSGGIGRSLAEASDAARLAQGRAEPGHFLHVDRLGLAQLLLAWTRTDTFQPAARSLLAPLAHETGDLVRTLAAYLDAESSLAETAAVLGVHRNTVAARIARIQHLLGVNLTEPDDRLALHLACRTALVGTVSRPV